MLDETREAAKFIQNIVPDRPLIGLILGSGLGAYADALPSPVHIPYTAIPHFARSTVVGHQGRLVFQTLEGFTLVAMQGRFHYYEGYPLEQVVFPIRVLGLLGLRHLIVSNAAGGVNPAFNSGDLMLITDHINLIGANPLRGPNEEAFGPRFPDMSEAYDKQTAAHIADAARELGIVLRQGVYAAVSGPSYETPAEIRMLRALGADAVGMSTVPEAIVANHMGIRVAGLSCITNMAAGIGGKLDHEDVVATAGRVEQQFIQLIDHTVRRLAAAANP